MKIKDLKIGDVLKNKRSDISYKVKKFVNEDVVCVVNLKYIGMGDYINDNTLDEYELLK